MINSNHVRLKPLERQDLKDFCALMDAAFAESEADMPEEEGRASNEIAESISKPTDHVMWVMKGSEPVGGAVIIVDEKTRRNMLMWFFIAPDEHSCGLGTQAWYAIERHWPETLVWELGTPYCDKRNINFYINKCGFHAVEFYNEHHPDPDECGPSDDSHCPVEESFRFEKAMNPLPRS